MKNFTFLQTLLVAIFTLLSNGVSNAQTTTVTYTSSSTITFPHGVTNVTVECWGAGGRGATRTSSGRGAGGGGGAYSMSVVPVTYGTTYTINVGTGSNNTSAGGDSWFDSSTTVMAKGGNSCGNNSTTGATGGSAFASVGSTKYNGGNGANASGSLTGGGGSSAGSGNNGNGGLLNAGGIPPFEGGAGGDGTSSSNANGFDGNAPGGGGGGARRTSGTRNGGTGGDGMVRITYTKTPTEYTLYYENFDNNDGGWTSSTASGKIGSWVRDNGPLVGQGNYFRTNNYNNFTRNTGIYLTSPVISTTGYQDIHFSIDIKHDLDADSGDGMQVQYSINGGAWTILNGTNGYYWYNNNNISGIGNTAGWTGLNTENANSPSKFNEASLYASVLDNRASVRFRVYFSDDNDFTTDDGVAIDNIVVRGNPITPFANPSFGPASVNADLKLWLKSTAGTGSLVDGNSVATWQDQAFDNHANSFGTYAPTYRDNASRNINYNPVIDFNRAAENHLKGKGGYWTNDYYVVVQTNSIFDKSSFNTFSPLSGKFTKDAMGQDGTGLYLGRGSSRLDANTLVSHMLSTYNNAGNPGVDSYGRGYSDAATTNMGNDVMIINVKSNTSVSPAVSEIYLNGKRIDNHTATAALDGTGVELFHEDFANLIYNLGTGQLDLNGFTSRSFFLDGKISEVFSYSTPKSALEQQKINSYLAIKNGVSLKSTSSPLTLTSNQSDINYLDSNGSVIWDAAANASYNYDVAGIGRDDNSQLNQKQSKSSNPSNLLSVGLGDLLPTNSANTNSFAINRNFLIWGDNGANMNVAVSPITVNLGPTTVTTLSDVSNRRWKFTEINGDLPEVKVAIPTASLVNLPALVGNDAYVMIVASDAAFTSNLETVFLTTNGANQECLYDFDGTKYVAFGVAHETVISRHTTYDGTDNYIKIGNTNNLTGNYTLSAWVRTTGNNGVNSNKTIVSKMNASDGYKLVLNNTNRIQYYVKTAGVNQILSTNSVLPVNEWHHIAVTYDGVQTKIYVDGVFDNGSSILGTVNTSNTFSIGAQYLSKTLINEYFRGDIDEIRIWDKDLSEEEMRFVMNQEIEQFGSITKGKIVPTTITINEMIGLTWNSLIAYYSMNSYIGTHLNDDSRFDNRGSLVVPNQFEIRDQTAPLPYVSLANGLWSDGATWTNGTIQTVPYSLSIVDGVTPINWNIVKTTHNVSSTGNKVLLALFNESGVLTADNDSKIQVSHYLKIDGKIDLQGESQLIQTYGSDLDPTSAGTIERDQDGTAVKFDYNYWCSPVGASNNTTNNNNFTVGGVLRDASDPLSLQNITWTNGINGAATSPITLSSYWIYKFQNAGNNYANWSAVGSTGTLSSAQGYTMKGPGTLTSTQNYAFVGKPNNGAISFTLSPNLINLTGNPYASAIDANLFILNNISKMTGTIYFWEHWGGGSHNIGAYRGGYSTYTMVGGVAALSHPQVNQTGSGTKTPRRYIPVGQGFFIKGNSTGGTINFNNNLRNFQKEAPATSVFTRSSGENAQDEAHFNNNENDAVPQDENFIKLRLNYKSTNGFKREVLVGFMNQYATSAIDPGYDALYIDSQVNDMYFKKGTNKLVILGESYFEPSAIFPLEVKNSVAGDVVFSLGEIENLPASQDVFIFDNVTNTYNSIKNQDYVVSIGTETISDRFSLVFNSESAVDAALDNENFDLESSLDVYYSSENSTINIKNALSDIELKSAIIYNLVGQQIKNIDLKKNSDNQIEIPVLNVSAGAYIVNVNTNFGTKSIKFIVK